MTAEVRTYENTTIVWDRGSRWSGYDHQQAEATLAKAQERGEGGHLETHRWTVEVPADRAHLYLPGITPEGALA